MVAIVENSPPLLGTTSGDYYIGQPYVVLYGCIVITGLISNIGVSLIILLLPRLRTAQNFFVLNLCIGDILLGINALFAFVEIVDKSWENDTWLCRVLGFCTFVPPIVTVLSMVVIAKNRYTTIVKYSPGYSLGQKRVWFYLAIVWIIAVAVSMPILLGLLTVTSGLFCVCCFYFSSNLLFGLIVTGLLFCLPNFLICWYYIAIFRHVRQSRLRVAQHSTQPSLSTQKRNSTEINLAIQFILLFVIFNICYLPTMIVFWVENDADNLPYHVRGIVMIIFALNLIANPVAYFILNRRARKETFARPNCCKSKPNVESNSRAENLSTTNAPHRVDQQATTHLTLPVSSSSSSSALPENDRQPLPLLKEPAEKAISVHNQSAATVESITVPTAHSSPSALENPVSRDQPPSLTYKLELPSISGVGNYLHTLDLELSSVHSSRACSTSSSHQGFETGMDPIQEQNLKATK